MPTPRNKGEKVLWERPLDFWNITARAIPAEAPLDRIEHCERVPPPAGPRRTAASQGARCMECGVPFCQSGAVLGGMAVRLPAAQPGAGVERPGLHGQLAARRWSGC